MTTINIVLLNVLVALFSFVAGMLVGRKWFGSLAYREGKYDQKNDIDFHKYWEE